MIGAIVLVSGVKQGRRAELAESVAGNSISPNARYVPLFSPKNSHTRTLLVLHGREVRRG